MARAILQVTYAAMRAECLKVDLKLFLRSLSTRGCLELRAIISLASRVAFVSETLERGISSVSYRRACLNDV